MIDFLYSIDLTLFYSVNHGMSNSVFDFLMPFVTDLNKNKVVLVSVLLLWGYLLFKGGERGRIAALLLIPTIVFSDQLNSSFIKFLFERMRPCHVLPDVHLLVGCGSGYSFPSSHAVNNFAGAFVLSYFLPKAKWGLFVFASVVAFSRVYVGVHYPSDVIGGAIFGIACGLIIIALYNLSKKYWDKWFRKTDQVA